MTFVSEVLATLATSLPVVFFVVDPIGVVPIFLALTEGEPKKRIAQTARRAPLVAGGVLIFFALGGAYLFRAFGVTLSAFRVAGGLLLILTALDMLRAQPPATRTTEAETQEGQTFQDVAIVPLGMPLLAGPGAIATVMVVMARPGSTAAATMAIVVAIAITMVGSWLILRGARGIQMVLRQTGIAIVSRVVGLILAAMGIQFIADGALELLSRHK